MSWENDKFIFYKPPVLLGFASDYNFLVLKHISDTRYMNTLEEYVDTLSGIYDKNRDELLNMIENNLSIFSMRIIDESTKIWSIDFWYFNTITGTLKNSLYSSAYYTIRQNKEKWNVDADERSKLYVNSCKILQTERWSFITKIWLPDDLSLVHWNLFSVEDIKANNVNNNFMNILDHINNIFFADTLPTVDDIASDPEMKEIILWEYWFQLIKNIKSIYQKSIGKSLDYKLMNRIGMSDKLVHIKKIEKIYTDNFDNIIKNIEKELKTEKIECSWYIYLTRTKNALEDKNHIELTDTEFWEGVRISMSLDSELFWKALEALKNHQKVRVVAEMTKINKTYSTDCSKIEIFELL